MDDEQVAEAILGYLAEHPEAMDTAKGIAEWWLMRQHIRVNVTMVARVLRHLTVQGVLDEIGPRGAPRYRLRVPRAE